MRQEKRARETRVLRPRPRAMPRLLHRLATPWRLAIGAGLAIRALLAPTSVVGQEAEAVSAQIDIAATSRVYSGQGSAATLEDVWAAAGSVDVVLLGETHNDRVAHAMQLAIFDRLADRQAELSALTAASDIPPRPVVLSLEMFETDIQYVLDEYLAGLISEQHFLKSSRPWTHYADDYRPLAEAAREQSLRVVAANASRRYVNRVSREGPEALRDLSPTAKRFLPPLPYAPPSAEYSAELDAVFSTHGRGALPDSLLRYGAFAQALWDATMAWSVADELQHRPGALVVHVVGSFHVRNGTGIPEHLARYRPGARTVTVIFEPVEGIETFPSELIGAADFVVLTDAAWLRTDPAGEESS